MLLIQCAQISGVVIEPLGSYRRGKPDSGDADILLSHRTELVTGPDCRCRIACSCTGLHGQVRVQIIRHARTHSVGKYQSCMF